MTEQTIILPESSRRGSDPNYRLTVLAPKRRFLSYLRERWWVLLTCMVLLVGAILTFETFRSETYESYAQLLVGDVQVNMANLFTEDPLNYFGTQIELLKSPRLQSEAMRKAGVQLSGDERNFVKLQVARPMSTSILQLMATGADPVQTQGFLQALIEEYLSFKKESRTATSDDIVVSLSDQLSKREAALKAEQEKWVEFQRTNNVAVLEEEGKAAGLYLAELNLQLAKFKIERDLLGQGLGSLSVQSREDRVHERVASIASTNSLAVLKTNTAIHSVASETFQVMGDTALKVSRVELAIRRAERDQVLSDRGEVAARHLSEDVTRLGKTVSILEEQNRLQRQADLQDLEKRIVTTQRALPDWQTKVLEINERLSQSQRLKNNIEREQGYRDHLLGMFQTVDLSRNVQQERLSILQPPTTAQPGKRFIPFRIAIAGVAAIAMGLGLVFVWHLADDRFSSVRDLQDQFGEEILGMVPRIRVSKAKPSEALLQVGDSRLQYLESFRQLRSVLLLSPGPEAGGQTLLVTSAAQGEGKSTIAANLARTLARSGMRVVLLDANIKVRKKTCLMGQAEHLGLLDFFRAEADLESIQQCTDIPGLLYVSAGTHKESAETFLPAGQMTKFMSAIRVDQDFVIVDGPSILGSDDVSFLVPQADLVVVVVRPFFTRSGQLRQALGMIYQRRAKQVSLVLNQARSDDLGVLHSLRTGPVHPGRNGTPRSAGGSVRTERDSTPTSRL